MPGALISPGPGCARADRAKKLDRGARELSALTIPRIVRKRAARTARAWIPVPAPLHGGLIIRLPDTRHPGVTFAINGDLTLAFLGLAFLGRRLLGKLGRSDAAAMPAAAFGSSHDWAQRPSISHG